MSIFEFVMVAVLSVEVVILAIMDRRLYQRLLTPFVVLSVPYLCVVLLTFFLAPLFGFVKLNVLSLVPAMAGLVLFWAGGLAAHFIMITDRSIVYKSKLVSELKSKPIVLLIALGSIVYMFLHFISAVIVVGPDSISGEAYRHAFGANWIRVLAMFLLVYFIATHKAMRSIETLAASILILLLIAYQVKGLVVLPIIAALIYRQLRGNFRLSIMKTALVVLMLFMVFVSVYMFGYIGLQDFAALAVDIKVYEHLSRHFFRYLFAGVLGYSNSVSDFGVQLDYRTIYTPVWNSLRHITGWERLNNVSEYRTVVDPSWSIGSNVNTMFGTLHMSLGSFHFGVFVFCLGLGFYMAFAVAIRSKNCWLCIIYCFWCSALAVGWFEYYFWHPFFLQATVYGLVLSVLPKLQCGGK